MISGSAISFSQLAYCLKGNANAGGKLFLSDALSLRKALILFPIDSFIGILFSFIPACNVPVVLADVYTCRLSRGFHLKSTLLVTQYN